MSSNKLLNCILEVNLDFLTKLYNLSNLTASMGNISKSVRKRGKIMVHINKKLVQFMIVTLGIVFLIASPFADAQGMSLSYGGNYPYGDLHDYDGLPLRPVITFSAANDSVVYSNSNMTLEFSTNPNSYPQGIQTLMNALTLVSYRASWQGNQTFLLYNATIDTPAILIINSTEDVPSGQGYFVYNFTDIPVGSQQLEVDVFGGGIIWGGNTYYTYYTNSSSTLNFTVQSEPAKEAFPTLLVMTVAIVVIVALCIGLLLYRRHQKTANLK